MKTLLSVLLLGCSINLAMAETNNYPLPLFVGDTNTMGRGVQRTMNLLTSSTPEHKNTVRILFYGQSITEQNWWKLVSEDLRRRFPNANLITENLAIGGHCSQLLVKTAEADLYPFYPDLLIFYVYGSHIEYENIIRRVRERTTAEIAMQTDHVTTDAAITEETDPAKTAGDPTKPNLVWDLFMNYHFLPDTAKKYGAELIDQRTAWRHYLNDNHLAASKLLRDGVHLNDYGCFVMSELVNPWLRLNPAVDDRAWSNWVRTFEMGKNLQWKSDRVELDFDGNRVDAIVANTLADNADLEVWIDGRRPSSFPELYTFNRVSAYQSNWPCLLRVQSAAPLVIEDWTLTLTEMSDDMKNVKFTLQGSKSGADGEGVSTNRFESQSRRIVIDPEDWNLPFCRIVFNHALAPGFQIHWQVRPLFQDVFHATATQDPTIENTITLAQGLANGHHHLELRGRSAANLAALRVYRPPMGFHD